MKRDELEAARQALRSGLVVGVPTDTVYGLAADPTVPGALTRIFEAKRRSEAVALPLLVAEPEELEQLAVVPARARRLRERFWPGPLTLVLARKPGIRFDLGGDPSTIGVRCPGGALVHELLAATGPLAVTSANLHGEPALHTAKEVRRRFGAALALVIDGGTCEGEASTVVSLRSRRIACLREGAIPFSEITNVASSAAASGAPARHPTESADGEHERNRAPDGERKQT
jgi:L-threonylcarbamoyladenylate synthase